MTVTEENEKKKEYLRGYERAVRQMQRSEERMKEIRLNRICPTVITGGGGYSSGSNDLSKYVAELDTEEKKYLRYRYERIKKCAEITNKIEHLQNEDEKDVLMYRYISLLKWEDICVRMKKSWKQIHRFHTNALKNFQIYGNNG